MTGRKRRGRQGNNPESKDEAPGAEEQVPARSGTRPLRGWPRPSVSVEGLIIITSAYFVVTANGAFWEGIRNSGALGEPGSWRLLASAALAIAGLHAILLGCVLNRWTVKPLLALLLVTTATAAYFAEHYAVYLDPGMIRNVLRTDTAEASELLTPGLVLSITLMGVVPAILVGWIRIKTYAWKQSLVRRMMFLLSAVALTAVALVVSFDGLSSLMRNERSLRYLVAPGNYLVSLARVLGEDARVVNAPRHVVGADARLVAHEPSTKPRFLVIVVGETVRAQNWGLNGYPRQTTPRLSTLDVVNFKDVTACGSNTEVSVPCMFSAMGRRNYDQARIKSSESLLHVLDHAGIKVFWRDNQAGCKGVCEGLAFESFHAAHAGPLCDGQGCRDEVMLQGLHGAIDENTGNAVVVLHQLGNHGPSYYKRYPPSFRHFVPDCRSAELGNCSREEIVNAYDNAILATDDFLAKAIGMLEQDESHDTALIYVSDHGESLGEGNLYLHGFPYAIAPDTQIKVPMLAWFSKGMQDSAGIDMRCARQRADKPASHDNLFHTVLGVMQVQTRDYVRELDLLTGCRPA